MTNTPSPLSSGEARMNEQRLALVDLGFIQTAGFCYSWTGHDGKVEFNVVDPESTWRVEVFRWVSPKPGRGFYESVSEVRLTSASTSVLRGVASALKAARP